MEFWQQKPGTTSEVKQLEKNWKNWKKQRNRDGEVRIQHEANTRANTRTEYIVRVVLEVEIIRGPPSAWKTARTTLCL